MSYLGTIDIYSTNVSCALAECPPGLFLCGNSLCFMTEYSDPRDGARNPIAYVVASGESFWGGASDVKERDALVVQPVEYLIPWGNFS